jgi:Uma2 family endonuclease
MVLLKEKEDKLITVEELFQMDLEEGYYYELLNGHIVKKQAPSPMHQKAVVKITTLIENFITEKDLGDCYTSPVDVFFDKYNNTQPDILFIKKERLFIVTEHGIEGHPDLIVDPIYKTVDIYSLENNVYSITSSAIESGEIESKTLTDFKIDIEKIFV